MYECVMLTESGLQSFIPIASVASNLSVPLKINESDLQVVSQKVEAVPLLLHETKKAAEASTMNKRISSGL